MATDLRESKAVWAFAEHEHRDLVRGINQIHDVACEMGHRPTAELAVHVLGVLGWFEHALDPHMAWEDNWLYPEVDRRTGTPWATRAARFDHQQIRESVARLRIDQMRLGDSTPRGDEQAETRCHLFGLEALLRAHIEREERFLIPILDDDGRAAAEAEAMAPRHSMLPAGQ